MTERITAIEAADITADVTMSADSTSGGSSIAVGGIVVRNDVRAGVLSDVEELNLLSGGDVAIDASLGARIDATLSGTVKAAS